MVDSLRSRPFKTWFQTGVALVLAATLIVGAAPAGSEQDVSKAFADALDAQPKLLNISGRFDGSGRMVFRRRAVHYEHKHWGRPRRVLFDGEPWTKLDKTPAAWRDLGKSLDLSRAWIVKRSGRDVIALEQTPDGFDLYISDSPNGAGDYAITLAIPRRSRGTD